LKLSSILLSFAPSIALFLPTGMIAFMLATVPSEETPPSVASICLSCRRYYSPLFQKPKAEREDKFAKA